VGVAGQARINSLTEGEQGTVYIPIAQALWRSAYFVVRSENQPGSVTTTAVRQRLTSIAGETVVDQVQSMELIKDIAIWQPRFFTTLFVAFAGIALVVAAVGLYGVMSYSVAQRTHELGVRLALGASHAGLIGMILRGGMLLTGIGLVIGVAGAVATGEILQAQLFEVRSTDRMTAAIVCTIVTITAAFASFLPARRATQQDPVVTLRHE
jgi:putative ABC transport system permease protein